MKHLHPIRRVQIFTDRYPLLGPWIYVLSLQYFALQWVVAAYWTIVPYSITGNVISDLGNTVCGQFGQRFVCSPQHNLMNGSFVLLGITMAVGSLLIYQEFKRTRLSLVAFTLMALSGVGTIMVGVFPENTNTLLHGIGAFMALGLGNLSMVLLAFAITQARTSFRLYTFFSGALSLVALALFALGIYLGFGPGGMERLVSYPQTGWLILFGFYMTATRVRPKHHTQD